MRRRDEKQKAAKLSALSPPLSSVKTALVFKDIAQIGKGSASGLFPLDRQTFAS